MSAGGSSERKTLGKSQLEQRISQLEKRLDNVLKGKLELEVKKIAVAPRSKLRVACE